MGRSETYEGSQFRAGIRVAVLLLRFDYIIFTKALTIFCVAKNDTIDKMCLINFIVVLSYRNYFVSSQGAQGGRALAAPLCRLTSFGV